MIKFVLLSLLFTLLACQTESQDSFKKLELITPAGDKIKTTLAIDPDSQEIGLSGVRPGDFSEEEGLLFFYTQDDVRLFWMPDTYFDLDLFYLDKDLKIIDIIRKLPHYRGRANPELIPRARSVWSRHVLEMKSTSEIAKRLKLGDKLEWKGPLTVQELEAKLNQPVN